MTYGNTRWAARVAALLVLLLEVAHAQPRCRASAAADLTIELEPPELASWEQLRQLQQRLDAELSSSELEACPEPSGPRRRAHVYVLARVPELSPTLVRVYGDDGARLERKLDVAALPAEVRPLAIASAAEELLAALLESTLASSTALAHGSLAPPAEPKATPAEPVLDERLPKLELGLGGGGRLFSEQGKAYGAEILARWRPRFPISAALSLGADRGSAPIPLTATLLAAGVARSRAQCNIWHLGFELGVDLLQPAEALWLSPKVGLMLARTDSTAELEFSTPVGPHVRTGAIGSLNAAASAGGEVGYRSGPWGIALALAVLVPLTPPKFGEEPASPGLSSWAGRQEEALRAVRWSGIGLGDQLGGQLDLRVWFALGS